MFYGGKFSEIDLRELEEDREIYFDRDECPVDEDEEEE